MFPFNLGFSSLYDDVGSNVHPGGSSHSLILMDGPSTP